ncbi:MAG: hypothetical protein ABFD84_15435 [Candidatus Polarisedimenticolia bacterium]
MSDLAKMLVKARRSGGSSASRVRLVVGSQSGPAVSGLPTSDSGYNVDLSCPLPTGCPGTAVTVAVQGDPCVSGASVVVEAGGATFRLAPPDPSWVVIAPRSVAANAPSTYLIPSGLVQRDNALKGAPVSASISGVAATSGTWTTVGSFVWLVPPYAEP